MICYPHLAERNRILAKVDAMMALCDRPEAGLDQSVATSRRLDALLHEALDSTAGTLEAAE